MITYTLADVEHSIFKQMPDKHHLQNKPKIEDEVDYRNGSGLKDPTATALMWGEYKEKTRKASKYTRGFSGEEKKEFGKRLGNLIDELNMSLNRFSETSGIPYGSLTNWVYARSMPAPETLLKLARALNTTTGYLIYGQGEPHMKNAEAPKPVEAKRVETEKTVEEETKSIEPTTENIIKNIRFLINAEGIDEAAAAARAGLSRSWFLTFDKNKAAQITVYDVNKWAKSLHISFTELTTTDVSFAEKEAKRKMMMKEKQELLAKLARIGEELRGLE